MKKKFGFLAHKISKLESSVMLPLEVFNPPKSFLKKNFKKAFTVAEVLVVMSLIGVVAAITIPSVMSHYRKTQNIATLKNAMSVFETAMNHMSVDSRATNLTTLQNFVRNNNCANAHNYFKAADGLNSCTFKTDDGLWWNLALVNKTIVSFNRADLNTANANDYRNKNAFYFTVSYDNEGRIRVNDILYEDENFSDNYNDLLKLYNYTDNVKDEASSYDSFFKNRRRYAKSCGNTLPRRNCVYENAAGTAHIVYDEEGQVLLNCNNVRLHNCSMKIYLDNGGTLTCTQNFTTNDNEINV